jgi:hypothetical protein
VVSVNVIRRGGILFWFSAIETAHAALNFTPPAHPLSLFETGPFFRVVADRHKKLKKFRAHSGARACLQVLPT